jgi:RES domain-containing protein
MTRRVAYRHAAYDTPWWAFLSSRPGRFHRAGEETTQYLSLHPLGPSAEMLRQHVGPGGNPDDVLLNLWVVLVEVDDVVRITFDDCSKHGITPDELVGDDYTPTQALADDVRAKGLAGLIVPSAALPGTENLVLFGARVLHPYLATPFSVDEVPTGHLSDGARPPAEVTALVRWSGTPHTALEQWKSTGTFDMLDDPLAIRFGGTW